MFLSLWSHGKSPFFHHDLGRILGTFSKHRTSKSKFYNREPFGVATSELGAPENLVGWGSHLPFWGITEYFQGGELLVLGRASFLCTRFCDECLFWVSLNFKRIMRFEASNDGWTSTCSFFLVMFEGEIHRKPWGSSKMAQWNLTFLMLGRQEPT